MLHFDAHHLNGHHHVQEFPGHYKDDIANVLQEETGTLELPQLHQSPAKRHLTRHFTIRCRIFNTRRILH